MKYNIDDILEKGGELIRTQGYNKTGIEEILKVCGIPKGSFYNFFRSKEDFGIKALEHYGDRQYQFVQSILTNAAISPLNRLKQFYNTLVGANIAEECRNGCLIGNLAQEMAGLSDQISETADRKLKRIITLIDACIKEGQKNGEIRDDYSSGNLANHLHNSFYGALMRAKSKRDQEPFTLFLQMTFKFIEKD